MVKIVYSFVIRLYCFSVYIASFTDAKAKLWVKGRKNWENKLIQKLKVLNSERIWMHCSSLGEFEQGRPLLDALRKLYPEKSIILSFFSPSGYTIRYNYASADYICYLPCDTPANAEKFVNAINPALTIFVKYDLWLNYFEALHKRKLPIILVSVLIKNKFDSLFDKLYIKKCYSLISRIFTQDQNSTDLLLKAGILNVETAGDTRVDRVASLPYEAIQRDFTVLKEFKGSFKVFICGSTWPEDEKVLMELFKSDHFKDWKAIIAPHEINEEHQLNLAAKLPGKAILLKDLNLENATETKFIIVNSMGNLNMLYHMGDLVYIGGGFGKGIHNTLEPAAYGIPVIIGPKYKKFHEANAMVAVKGFKSIRNAEQLLQAFDYYSNHYFYKDAFLQVTEFINKNQGATERITSYIRTRILN